MNLEQEVQQTLARLKGAPRKKLSQNFMVNPQALQGIVETGAPQAGEEVLEIGPGLGFLTRLLLERGAIVAAVEMDELYATHLQTTYGGRGLKVYHRDILQFDLVQTGFKNKVRIFGNIPYNITSPILEWIIIHRSRIVSSVLTVQREVAERLAAAPGGKEWGPLSLFVQFYAKVSIPLRISRDSFYPAPKVDSAVIRLDFLPEPVYPVKDEALFFRIARGAFQKRRKTLLNGLFEQPDLPNLSKATLSAAMETLHIDPVRRPETLQIDEWGKLVDFLSDLSKKTL